MKPFALAVTLLFSCFTFSQRNPEFDTLKKEKEQVKQTVLKFFEGFHTGDTSIIKKTVHKDLVLQTIYKNKESKNILHTDDASKFFTTIATRPSTQRWDERLLLFKINVEGSMANVWTPYEFWYNEQFSHCGVNSFQLIKEEGNWKIFYLVDTRRKVGCRD
ncbi:nuclear transport factor 2 family protein [Abyssalbus ytuae]|uniref:Nuclear transport factor 2 family protein n=1 Tax=Abyssalbus ytuae TaxID=2926907 RepID=A0A9E6ZMB3_9FLAO|nr:nuclear transport factor 2 family protein [Abyssalbus ytuae]UOB17299.1 nuclear transport factor 2 family protein [Abyssalbus ytuae]